MIKETLVFMQNQNIGLNNQIQSSTKNNNSEIVGLVVSLLEKPEMSKISHRAKDKTEGQNKCDICEFESENKKLMASYD